MVESNLTWDNAIRPLSVIDNLLPLRNMVTESANIGSTTLGDNNVKRNVKAIKSLKKKWKSRKYAITVLKLNLLGLFSKDK